MSIKHSGKSIQQQVREFRAFAKDLPNYVGTEAVRFFKGSFDRQGFIDTGSVEKWKPRNVKAKRNKGRKVLVDKAVLKRSIRITEKTAHSVTVGTNVPYAQIHNEGGKVKTTAKVRAHNRRIKQAFGKKLKTMKQIRVNAYMRKMNFTMPQRQFIGRSRFFERRIEMQSIHKLKNILKQ